MSLLSNDSFLYDSPMGISPDTPGPVTPPPCLPSPARHHFARSISAPLPRQHASKPQIRFAPLVHITAGIKAIPEDPSILKNLTDGITSDPAHLTLLSDGGQRPHSPTSSLASSFDLPLRADEPVDPGVTPTKRKVGNRRRKPTPLPKAHKSTSRFYERLTDDDEDLSPSSDDEPSAGGGGSLADPFAEAPRQGSRRQLRVPVLPRLRLAYSPSLEDLAAAEARERAALLADAETKRRRSYGTSAMRKNGQQAGTYEEPEEKPWWREVIACWGCWDDDEEGE